jgi:type IX secretion system PorP/SprF family membrane protein
VILISAFFLFSKGQNLYAQEILSYSSIQSDKINLSPSFAGFDGNAEIFSSVRRQWAGIAYAPASESLSFDTPVNRKTGLGISISDFSSGNFKQFRAQTMYSYKLKLKKDLLLAFGFDAQIFRTRLNISNVVSQGNDPILQNSSVIGSTVFDAGSSLLLNYKTAFVGFSIPSALATDAKIDGTPIKYARKRDFLFHGSYLYKINEIYYVEPSLVYAFKGSPTGENTIFQMSAALDYLKKFSVGFGYSFNNGFSIFTEIALRSNINLQYVCDFGGNAINSASLGTHRLVLSYRISEKEKQHSDPIIIPKNEENINFSSNNGIDNSEIEKLHNENERIRSESNRVLSEHEKRIRELENKIEELSKNQKKVIQETWEEPQELKNIRFGPNSDKLYSSSFPELNKIVNRMVKEPKSEIRISEFNNEDFPGGYNLYLSEKRAKALGDYLINRGISPQRIKFEGKGSENRELSADEPIRVEIQIKKS